MLIYGLLFIYLGLKIIKKPVFISARYHEVIDLRPFEWPFGLALITIGIIMVYMYIQQHKRDK